MDNRYSLRFETGERRGETIPIQGTTFTIGRKPGHSLQILDNSVSGKHAELFVDDAGVLLRDAASTNGTRVGVQRVVESRLAHGDLVTFGNVQLVFLDATIGTEPAPEAHAPTVPVMGSDALARVSPDLIARSGKKSRLGLVLVAVLLAGGAAAWYFTRPAGGAAEAARAVPVVADNLLAQDFSFETDADAWEAAEGAPAAFLKGAQGRYSGAMGMACDLAAGDHALHRSRQVRVDAGRELLARAALRSSGAASARLGVEFLAEPSSSSVADLAAPGAFVAWSAAVAADEGFAEVEIQASVPPGYAAARVVVEARAPTGSGSAAFDDASLVSRAGAGKPAAQLGDWQLHLHGAPPSSAMIYRVGTVLVSGLESADRGAISASAEGPSLRLSMRPPARRIDLRAEAPLARGGIASIAGGIAEGAAGTYKTHGQDFERAEVGSLLLGTGADLLCFRFASPVRVRSVADGAAARIAIEGAGIEAAEIQLDFREERKKAGDVAHAARNAEKKGDLGECLKQWGELLNAYPYEEQLVAEAERVRAKLIQQGLEELRQVRQEVERARFFRLVDLFRQCRQRAVKVGERYRSSEVETEAQGVAVEVERDLADLEVDLTRAERDRLTAILRSLEAQKADALAGEVKSYLETRFGGGK